MNISVLGDSHSRVFSNANVFTSFFLGPGMTFNLIEKTDNIKKGLRHILPLIKNEFNYHMLIFGEPSSRYQIKKDFYIHKTNFKDINRLDEKILKESTEKYKEVINICNELIGEKLIICAPIVVYNPALLFSEKFNEIIKDYCVDKQINFIDISDKIVKDYSVEKKYKSDPIHASSEIIPFIIEKLKEKNININSDIEKKYGFKELKSKFIYNKKFKTYLLKQ